MSDHIVKITASNPFFRANSKKLDKAVKYLKKHIVGSIITGEIETAPQFVDCGSNLDRIICPFCKKVLTMDWWSTVMDERYADSFINLNIITPCCGKETTLNDLVYELPCAFARTIIKIENPDDKLSEDMILKVEKIIGSHVKIINAHY